MAETDHGEVLTRFEEIFGSLVEHEVIKLILQSCDWDAATASDTLLGMIDKNNLPPHMLSALTADSIVRNLARRHSSSCQSLANQEMGPEMSDQPMSRTQMDEEGESLPASIVSDTVHMMSSSPAKSTMPGSTSRTSVIIVPPSVSAFHNGSPSSLNQNGVEGRGGATSPLDASFTRDGESETSSPSLSPLRSSRSAAAVGSLESSASQWVLAPEFVPNAFNIKASDVGNKNSMWLQGMSCRLMDALPASASPSPKHLAKGGKLSKKEEIIAKILSGAKIMILMRGLPGSGKSTLAREFKGPNGIVLSTDDFFCDKHGKYVYDASKIGEAHQWNRHRTSQKLKQGKTPVIIDNTNLQKWEMKPYVKLALQYGYDIDILEADSLWRLNPKELARKNTHGVPGKKIEEMKERYERDIKIDDIIADLQGTVVVQSSPCKNNLSKTSRAVTSGNDLMCTEIAKLISYKTPEEPIGNQDTKLAEIIKECSEIHSLVKAEIDFDTDEDVVVEQYDEEIQITKISKNIPELGCEIKETVSVEDERLDIDTSISKETENEIYTKENILSENLDPPIDLISEVLTYNAGDEEKNDQEILDNSDKLVDKPSVADVCELISGTDGFDEIKIQNLLDEASNNIDFTKSEEEWDNLTSLISGEDLCDEKFNDLVASFGSVLKKQIENRDSIGIPETKNCSTTIETISEDVAMYDLCSTMEDKTGQSLLTLVTRLSGNDGFVDIPFINNTEEGNGNSKPSSIEAQTENLSRSLVGLNLNENVTDSPSSGKEESTKPVNDDNEHVMLEPSIPGNCEIKEKDEECKQVLNGKNTNYPIPDEPDQPASEDTTQKHSDNDSLAAWECIDINSGLSSMNWDSQPDSVESDKNAHVPKPVRTQRNRMPGNPSKWLKESGGYSESIDDAASSWVAVEGGTPQWDTCESVTSTSDHPSSRNVLATPKYFETEEPQSHTGAVSKFRKRKRHSASPSKAGSSNCNKSDVMQIVTVYQEQSNTCYKEAETQTLSIDFEALELDHKLYELNVLYGQPHYIPVATVSSSFSEKGPLTKGELRLEKGTMTDNPYENSVSSFQNLIAFFPNIPKDDLRDVFEKCRHDSDWAMNVLLDSGYEMSDPSDTTVRELTEVDIETDSVSETTNTDDGKNDQFSSDACDVLDNFPDERTRKIRQSQQPEDLAKKHEIEKSFEFPQSVDDRVLRLTGKQFNDLNMTKVKKSKTKKVHRKESNSPSNIKTEEVEGEGEGAQYITLVMDPLFASQLNMMFGPAGDCEISGDLTPEDRSVVLPLEICEMIHKYWARTVDGKFKHEAEILDSLIRQDEILARKLQEEENAAFNISGKRDDATDDGLLEDQPVHLKEIMDLEQALQESLADKTSTEDTSISSVINLRRLRKEYPHIDPVALKEEYTRNGFKYHVTVERLNQRYGKEQAMPKTVIAPEALRRYEQEMIERAQQNSLAEEELEISTNQHDEIIPDDPQVFRDEAQAHYHQRQEAFQKAQEASRRGMRAAAAYYAHLGNLHSEKLHEANQRASQKILEAKNAHRKDANCLDLHLLHVAEAISATQAFLNERQRVLIARGIKQMEVSLITGRGVHSSGGQAVLKPVIREHLQRNGYSFYEANSGMLKVNLRAKPS